MSENVMPDTGESAAFYAARNNWVDYVSERTDLHPTTRLIGIWIVRRISADGDQTSWYQVSTIAERLGQSPRTVIRAVQSLEREGLLRVRRDQRRGLKKAVNRYEFIGPWWEPK